MDNTRLCMLNSMLKLLDCCANELAQLHANMSRQARSIKNVIRFHALCMISSNISKIVWCPCVYGDCVIDLDTHKHPNGFPYKAKYAQLKKLTPC